ncbi:ATP-binding protein [Massilia sp. W12]|uniref:ATP-binding protein n=1 Tax=Massilia sp. W12 TaxID=3126507 RepID=UPI0030D5AF73
MRRWRFLREAAMQAEKLENLLQRAESLLQKLEQGVQHWLPGPPPMVDFSAPAYRWRNRNGVCRLQPVTQPAVLRFEDLHAIAQQKQAIEQNTAQFVAGRPANNVLLTGARGTGKSSLIKACLQQFHAQGLRLIEVERAHLDDLPDIVELLAARSERFIIFCDDLSFEAGEPGYKALKVVLDGSIAGQAGNVLVYATSNRRHLLPENFSDNAGYSHSEDGDLHPAETVEEKIALSERFGLWLSFYAFNQDAYLDIVAYWMGEFGAKPGQVEAARADALRWALQRGSRSGRVAQQFARDWAGRQPG